ncbi:Sialic acid TRAP transporter permease protein SiaT [Sporomusa silvacetica DSM 10669]|uniref:Sialic acid TRAP transporter permease protein SiaT n=1 Tax=Sporomusa silvacetica DSM 10669 TaxID=1123289 RepID=A0ABZ3IUE8_9FIRM|nr:TRAP transporter large permease subunit [Sporomusa silvacetica]OZC19568.1 sialic acid TRAP transporter permease protein SiaT [Sporomusa silvacetica DSM 10669]
MNLSATEKEPLAGTAANVQTVPVKDNIIKRCLDTFLDIVVGLSVIGELIIVFGSIVAREAFNIPVLWADEVGQLVLTLVAFLGGALAYTRNEHIAVHAIVERLPKSWRPFIDAIVEWMVFATAAACAYFSLDVITVRWMEYTAVLDIRMGWFVIPLTVGLILMALYALLRLCRMRRGTVMRTAVVVVALLGGLILFNEFFGPFGASAIVNWIVFITFAIQLCLGVPVGFVLAVVSMMYLFLSGRGNLTQIPMTMQNGILNFVLLSIPFFMMAGYIMTEGGLSKRLADFVVSLVGRFRSGLLQAMVVTMYIFAGLSGSKAADVAAVGSTMGPMLKDNGYDKNESAAVLAAATVMGETIPPSLPMLILGSITTISMGSLFMAGLMPAAVIAITLMLAIYIKARIHGQYPGDTSTPVSQVVKRGMIAVPALLVPVFLIGGIVSGLATPTEISTFAVVYSLILAAFIYKELDFKKFWNIMLDTSVKAGMVLFITSAGCAFSWTLTAVGIPQKIAQLMIGVAGHTDWIFMLITVIVLVVMGALLEGIPALLVFAPMLVPIVPQFGIDPLQYGMVLIIAMGLGAFSPPVGIGFYVVLSVCGTTMEETSRAMLPYLVVLFIGLLLVAFVPWFSLVIPKMMQMYT